MIWMLDDNLSLSINSIDHSSEIVSFTTIDNHRSSAVMERLGMNRDVETFEHSSLPPGHSLREHCLYRLSRGKWRSNL